MWVKDKNIYKNVSVIYRDRERSKETDGYTGRDIDKERKKERFTETGRQREIGREREERKERDREIERGMKE